MRSWLLLTYKVPRAPTSSRVYVWRKLKQLGALLMNDAAWVLPSTAQTIEQFQWLTIEIQELGGEVTVWQSTLILDGTEAALVDQFTSQVEIAYREILSKLKRANPDLGALSRRFQQLRAKDYFHCALRTQVIKALISAKGGSKK